MSRQQWNSLNSPDILCTLTSKLPGNARDKWNRKVLSIRRHRAEDPELADFIDFINDETLLASDPLFSREALKVYVEKEERSHLKKKMKSYASNTTDKVQEEKDAIKEMKCPVCEEKHDLDNCKQFSSMSVDERSKMLRKKRLCYGCYLPVSAEHTAKTCKKRRVCKICAMKHPTGLHGYVPRWKVGGAADNSKDGDSDTVKTNFAEMDVKSASANMASKIISMCVVPIKITHAETKREVSTFAMLDNCSQGCFIKNNIRKGLGAGGRKTEIIIKTLNGNQEVASTVISGLKVASDIKGARQHWLDLPATYTREELPADVGEVATRDKLAGWEHLKELVDKVPRKSNIEIGLLIGANCAKTLELQEIIPSKDGGQFAFRSPFGWRVVGPLTKSTKKNNMQSSTCKRCSFWKYCTPLFWYPMLVLDQLNLNNVLMR